MVKRINISKWTATPVPTEEQLAALGGRSILGVKPLYAPADVLAVLAEGPEAVVLFTQKCRNDVASRPWSEEDVHELLEFALTAGKQVKPEWCAQSPTGPVAACDVLIVCRREKHPDKGTPIIMEYYLKFAISMNNNKILVASCHSTIK